MSSGRFRLRRLLFRSLLIALVAYVIWDRVEAYRLSRTIAAIAARGEPVRDDEALPAPRTDEQRQASNLYAQAAALAREQSAEDNHRAGRLDVDNPKGNELSLDDIAAAYRDDSSPLQVLDRASPLDFGGFRVEDRAGSGMDPLVELGALACLRADLAAARGEGDAAAAALVPCVRLQRTLTSSWSRSGHAARVLGSLRILLRHTQPSEPALAALQRAFDGWPDHDQMLQELLQQRARFIEIAEDGMQPYAPALARMLFHPFVSRSGRMAILSFEPAIAVARLPLADRAAAIQSSETLRAYRPPPLWRFRMVGALFDPFPMAYAPTGLSQAKQELAARRVAVSAVAAERFRRAHAGAAPDSLAALVPTFLTAVPDDPFSMQPLLYRREADNYVLYSVDANRKDDGGEIYGHGAAIAKHVGPQSPRDLGIRVPLTVARH